jgi:hypothetical protein
MEDVIATTLDDRGLSGAILFALGALISCLNFYASFLRYPVHRLRGGTRENYRWSSGLPLIGSLALWASIPLLLHRQPWPWVAFGLSLLDTGGLHWFAGTMLWMSWRERRSKREL